MDNLILHLGVHKTATTYFQSRLYNSKKILSDNRVGYLGLDATRRAITSKLHDKIEMSDELKDIYSTSKSLIISDENIIGGTERITSQLIYPDVYNRLVALKKKIKHNNVEANITIRDPEAYLISRYCEYLRHYRFVSIGQYFDSFNLNDFSWNPLLSTIEEALQCKVNVTCFENIFEDEVGYLNSITNLDIDYASAGEGSSIKRSKISLESYRILEHLADHYPAHMTRKLVNMMDNNKQKGKPTPLRPFSDEISQRLKENYESDKKKLNLL
ncbi:MULTISPECIES: hypothetical protein [unclassified Cobetia]|uniref:hypothetical protein n=1 Tax=unclassified Cobetia TaxID=2609414 RepID=UPI00178D028E|nr:MULTISPECIES: hypothetical protein [unclassified Cobetia]MBE2169943.1 hypothetical protein [Cobetia sp. 2AS1]MDH2446945.1 hypothetical protein [Cobetia sp. 2AS]